MSRKYPPEEEIYIEELDANFLFNIKLPSFNNTLEVLTELNAELPTARDLFFVMLKTRKNIYGVVKEEIISYPGEGNLLIRDPLVLQSKEFLNKSVEAHFAGREAYLNGNTQELLGEYLQKAKKCPRNNKAIFLGKNHNPVSLDKFKDDKKIRFMFDDLAEKAAEYLSEKEIKELKFYSDSEQEVDKHPHPYINPIWFTLSKGNTKGFLASYKFMAIKPIYLHAIQSNNTKPSYAHTS